MNGRVLLNNGCEVLSTACGGQGTNGWRETDDKGSSADKAGVFACQNKLSGVEKCAQRWLAEAVINIHACTCMYIYVTYVCACMYIHRIVLIRT